MTDVHDVASRVAKIEGDLYRPDPENPGALLRLDRVERLLSTMLKVGAVMGGIGVAWKALEVIGSVVASKVTQ